MAISTEIATKLEAVFNKKQASVLTEVILDAYGDLVKTSDFNELKGIVKELGVKVGELAEAQKKSEARLTRVEIAIEKLADAQITTEMELRELVKEHKKTRSQLGGLSMTVGYTLENEAFRALPGLLKRDSGLVIKDRLKRQYVMDNTRKHIEVNIIGEASRNTKKVFIIGEGKVQLSKNDVDNFIRRKLKRLEGVYKDIFPVLITHMTAHPNVEKYARERGIALYYSYDF